MDEAIQYNNNEQTMSQARVGFFGDIDWMGLTYKAGIILAGVALMFFVILLKSKTTIEFNAEPYFFSYAVFVSVFIFSRIIAAMFYKSSFATLTMGSSYQKNSEIYEPNIAFIIPCKNEEKDIENTISKCFQAEYPKNKMEIIVINDGSTDGTQAILEQLQKKYPMLVIIHFEKNKGKRHAMTAGFRKANAEIVIQLDSDSYINPSTVRTLLEPFQNEEVGGVCASGEPTNANHNIITRMQTAYYFMSFHILKAAESTYDTVFCCSGCCSAYRKDAVMPVIDKWLNESFLGLPVTWGDDRALTSWLMRTDWKTVFSQEAIAYTVVPDSFKKLFTQQLRWKKSWIVNFFFTSKFIFIKQPFVALFYYLPLFFISILAPFMTFRALLYAPITSGILPLYHITGVLLITAILVLYYRVVDRKNKFWPYLFLWSLLNLFLLSFVIVWAAIRIQDRGWGTR